MNSVYFISFLIRRRPYIRVLFVYMHLWRCQQAEAWKVCTTLTDTISRALIVLHLFPAGADSDAIIKAQMVAQIRKSKLKKKDQ